MASPAHFLRLCLRPGRRVPSLRAAAVQQPVSRRPLSTTQWRPAAPPTDNATRNEFQEEVDEEFGNPGHFLKSFLRDENISDKERALATRMLEDWQKVPLKQQQEFDKLNEAITEEAADLRRPVKAKRQSFWNAEEVDTDLITDEIGEDDFEEDDIMAMGHAKLEEHREFREYARVAVWEMPLLSSKLASAVLFLG